MKVRAVITVLLVVFHFAALLAGNWHKHREMDRLEAYKHCAACVWQVNAVADLPPIFFQVSPGACEFKRLSVETLFVATQFSPTSASRAPPGS